MELKIFNVKIENIVLVEYERGSGVTMAKLYQMFFWFLLSYSSSLNISISSSIFQDKRLGNSNPSTWEKLRNLSFSISQGNLSYFEFVYRLNYLKCWIDELMLLGVVGSLSGYHISILISLCGMYKSYYMFIIYKK